jgi:CBS domain-containing protein
MKTRDIMTRDARSCRATDSVNRAAQLMWDNDCGCVPVVDEAGKIAGMITDRDVCMAAYTQGRPLVEIPVSRAMSSDPITVRESDDVDLADELMRKHRVRRLPVVDVERRLVGVISLSDLARNTQAELQRADGVDAELLAETLTAVSLPNGSEEVTAAHAA